jgi:hypothetical protein
VTLDEVIDVIAVRHGLVPAAGAVNVTLLVGSAIVLRRTAVGILRSHIQDVLVDVVPVDVVQMPVVQIVHMTVVLNGRVAAVGAVLMDVILVRVALLHDEPFLR